MKRVLQCCSVLLLLGAASAHAQLYKWVGPDGKVTYSDTAPPKVAHVETKALAAPSSGSAELPFELSLAVKNHPVTLYTTRECAPCEDGRKLLGARGIPYTEKTVNSNEDASRLREVTGDTQLPFLTIGSAKQRGFEAGAWNGALSAAGYPEKNLLPKSYRNPPPEAAAPAPKQVAAKRKEPDGEQQADSRPRATDLPPAKGNAPPGFRF